MALRFRSDLAVAIRAFYQASPRLTIATLVVATIFGLLQPAFVVATGVLVQAAASGSPILVPLTALAVVFTTTRVLGPLRDELGLALWRRVDQSMGDRIMQAISSQPGLEHVEDPRIQDLVVQAEGAVTGYSVGVAAQQLVLMWSQRTFGLVALAIVFRTYWWAALLLGGVHALGYAGARWHWLEVTLVIVGRIDQMRRAFYLRELAVSSAAAKETRVFGLARWLVERYRHSAREVLHEVWGKRREGWPLGIALSIMLAGTEALTIWIAATDSLAGRIDLGTAVAIIQAIFAAAFLSMYLDPDWSITQAAEFIGKVARLEDSVRAQTRQSGGRRDPAGLPQREMAFENISFTYPGGDRAILQDFNLTIEAGKSLAIVGENGAGKTTLVKLLSRLYEPTSGRITVDGIDIRELDATGWHQRIAAVFQDFAHFELPAYDNVAFGALRASQDAQSVERAAHQAGAAEIIRRLPLGWTTPLSRELSYGTQLSGGEWQRLALARALFGVQAGAGVLILDEPTASLDVRGEAEVYQRFLELTRGLTTLVISHRFSTVRRADRIVVVEHGRVVESGSHSQLVQRKGRYAEMYALQAARFAVSSAESVP
jgi:ATP-binding cassette, subfamily B, bacterial